MHSGLPANSGLRTQDSGLGTQDSGLATFTTAPGMSDNRRLMKPARALLEDVLASLRRAAVRYADIRYTETLQQDVRVRNGEVDHLASTVDRAIGVRVLIGNGWGFAASSDTSEASLRATARRAL